MACNLVGQLPGQPRPLGDNWSVGADVLFNKVRHTILVQDYRDRPITGASALTPDGRQRYFDIVSTISPTRPARQHDRCRSWRLCPDQHPPGRGFVAVAHINKHWDFGLSAGASFTYQNVKDQQALTSSIAASNYNNGAYLDANGGAYGHSNDEIRYSIKYNLSYEHAWFGDYKTRIDLFGQTRSGYPFSYTFFDPNGAAAARARSSERREWPATICSMCQPDQAIRRSPTSLQGRARRSNCGANSGDDRIAHHVERS